MEETEIKLRKRRKGFDYNRYWSLKIEKKLYYSSFRIPFILYFSPNLLFFFEDLTNRPFYRGFSYEDNDDLRL